jgi:hypothetical protein
MKEETRKSFDWVIQVIESSYQEFHFRGCARLIQLFDQVYKEPSLTSKLYQVLDIETDRLSLPRIDR